MPKSAARLERELEAVVLHRFACFLLQQSEEGKHTIDAKVETYNLFYSKFEDVRGPLEMPVCQDVGKLSQRTSFLLQC